jgi:hypothetical protein
LLHLSSFRPSVTEQHEAHPCSGASCLYTVDLGRASFAGFLNNDGLTFLTSTGPLQVTRTLPALPCSSAAGSLTLDDMLQNRAQVCSKKGRAALPHPAAWSAIAHNAKGSKAHFIATQVSSIVLPNSGQRLMLPPAHPVQPVQPNRKHSSPHVRGANSLPPLQHILTSTPPPTMPAPRQQQQQQQQHGFSTPPFEARHTGGHVVSAAFQALLIQQQGQRQQY